jgi:hypothetical protein
MLNLSITEPVIDWRAIATRSTRQLMMRQCACPHGWVKGEFIPVGTCERCLCIADFEAAMKAEGT